MISLSVRRLTRLYRRGGLGAPAYGGATGPEGIAAHNRFFRALEESQGSRIPLFEGDKPYLRLAREVDVRMTHDAGDFLMRIGGRVDGIVWDGTFTFYEIKSFQGNPDLLPEDHAEHWAQLKLYAAMARRAAATRITGRFAETDGAIEPAEYEAMLEALKGPLKLRLVYAAIDADTFVKRELTVTPEEDARFFNDTLALYLRQLRDMVNWRKLRDASIAACTFPYDDLRDGQREFMQQALAALRDTSFLFAQAPTGIGKTMSVLYPAVKALQANFVQRIFYATAMTSTRQVAAEAVADLREAGCRLRSLVFRAKETMCPVPELYCDHQLCPYAVDYYERLPEALADLFVYENLTPEIIGKIAEKHQVCPFELSLDIAEYCDILIGDYNHIFDPRVQLERFFVEPQDHTALLIDEAHNLPSRGRTMYSAALSGQKFVDVYQWLTQPGSNFGERYPELKTGLMIMIQGLHRLNPVFENGRKPADCCLYTPDVLKDRRNEWIIAADFIGSRTKPDRLLKNLAALIFRLRGFLEENKQFENRRMVMELWFDCLHFSRVGAYYYNHAYIMAARPGQQSASGFAVPDVYLLCLDAAAYLTDSYRYKQPAIFFSATLSPMHYYQSLLDSEALNDQPEKLILPSPFPPENRLIVSLSSLSVKYKDRERTLPQVAAMILKATELKVGNYLIFSPSYAYQRRLVNMIERLRPAADCPDCRRIVQQPGMKESQKRRYLEEFNSYGERTLQAFAVIGSSFSEGIDLVGERLEGIIIVGCGIPQLSPERQIMAQYYGEEYGNGYAYGFIYPGFNRVQQAVGRLIRSPEDTGIVLLIDSRYGEAEWQSLYPADWEVRDFTDPKDALTEIKLFWKDRKLAEQVAREASVADEIDREKTPPTAETFPHSDDD